MKQAKGKTAKRTKRSAVAHKKSTRQRPAHKRLLLNPLAVFLLLCIGVLVAGSTFRGSAESYDVTATVHAPALSEPAVITSLTHGQRVTQSSIDVVGHCPADSYIKLYRNALFGGAASCDSGRFTIKTSLSTGGNELKVRAFNATDDEGPASDPLQVFYNVSEPSTTPTSLKVAVVEEGKYRPGTVPEVSVQPTITGVAPPFSDVTVTFYSEPSICKTKADAKGIWACTLSKMLEPGVHHVVITAITPEGQTLTFPTFEIKVVQHLPFQLSVNDAHQIRREDQTFTWQLAVTGGTPPYTFVIDWGDGSTERIVHRDRAALTLRHKYGSPVTLEKKYAITIAATDAANKKTTLQLSAVIKGSIVPVSGGTTTTFGSLLDGVQGWLWIVWPVYIGVVLMAISFWIGEREAYQRFLARSRKTR